MKVSLHQLKDNIYVLELPRAGWQHDVLDFHNVCTTTFELSKGPSQCRVRQTVHRVNSGKGRLAWMPQQTQQLDFPQYTSGI